MNCKGRRYSPEEDTFVLAHYKVDMSMYAIGNTLSRTPSSVAARWNKLQSRTLLPPKVASAGRERWRDDEERIFLNEWGRVSNDTELTSYKNGRSIIAMQQHAYFMGITKRENRGA